LLEKNAKKRSADTHGRFSFAGPGTRIVHGQTETSRNDKLR
jgi:hypothetical protein